MKAIILFCALPCLFAALNINHFYSAVTIADDRIQDGLQKSDTITVQDLRSLMRKKANVKIINVRLPKDLQADPSLIPSATWQDPSQVEKWAKTLPKDTPIVVYCVHGHRVSQQAAERLRSLGYPARRLAGGIHAWKEMKGATTPLNH